VDLKKFIVIYNKTSVTIAVKVTKETKSIEVNDVGLNIHRDGGGVKLAIGHSKDEEENEAPLTSQNPQPWTFRVGGKKKGRSLPSAIVEVKPWNEPDGWLKKTLHAGAWEVTEQVQPPQQP